MRTLIKNCRLVSPGKDLPGAAIVIEGDAIIKILEGKDTLPDADKTFDAAGRTVLPGFIDIHVHGAAGFDVMDGTREAIERIAEAKLEEGVTTFCPTTLTLPEDKLAQAMKAVEQYRLDPKFAKVAGVHLEGPFINPDYAGAQNPEHVRAPDLDEVLRLHALSPIAIVSYAIELDADQAFLKGLVSQDIVASCGHSGATFEQFRRAREAGLKHLTHFGNQMSPLHHRAIGLVGAGLLDDEVLLEMICDKIHLCPEMIELVFKRRGSGRIALVTDAICAAGLSDGDYSLGGLEVRVEGGAARLCSTGALAGSILPFQKAMKHIQEITKLPLHELVKATSLNQARSLGLDRLGRIEPGCAADLVILDEAFEIRGVFLNGEQRL
ncbi:MAG: N-acetylglucosamine-6-phosphate deacetylase [Planctomycetota bacterium]|jgi:N-acetylglucosamine-6-phosphate deacetylase